MRVSTIAVPIGAAIGLLLAMYFFPTNMGIVLGTLIGGMIGGMVGLYIAQQRNK